MKSDKLLWILEDDPSAIFIYEDILKLRYQTEVFRTLDLFVEALKIADGMPDLLISDLRLGEQSFLDFLNSEESLELLKMPFIVVSGLDDVDVLRLCFKEGAVDYITKPFMKNELLVKIERLLQRSSDQMSIGQVSSASSFLDGVIVLDPYAQTLKRSPDVIVNLTSKELLIYSLLNTATQKGESISRRELTELIWGSLSVSSKSLDVHLFHLRKKLKVLCIQLVYKDGCGYSLVLGKAAEYE